MSAKEKVYLLDNELLDVVHIKKPVDYKTSLAIMKSSDWLIHIDANLSSVLSENIFFAAKLADYIGAGRPIFAITMFDGAGADVIRDVNGLTVSYTADEIRNYLYSQLQKIENANLVFDIISKGYVKFKDILNYSRISSSPTLVDTLNKLIQMELIKKEYPINDENNNKIAKYLIDDNLSLFFYTFIYPYSSTLSIMSPDTFFDLMIKEKFYRYYVPKIFEKVSKEYLIRQNKLGLINPPFIKIGKYYYDDPVNKRNGEFDIVSEDINGFTFYECKYIEKKINEEIINEEIEEVSKTSFNVSRYGFFSKKGYELKNRINENIKLYTLEDLYRK